MKTIFTLLALASALGSASGATTINPTNHFAYGANPGWIDWRGDTTNGAVIGEYVCSGYIYAANAGWINLGGGHPVNGIRYQNNSAADFGVNHDGFGGLRGYAWGANVGWINFEAQGAPQVDLGNGQLSGFAWSANLGWISLSNAVALVRTDWLEPGADTDGNGLPDAWERQFFGRPGIDPAADADGDGTSNQQEYLAGTNPTDPNDHLRITTFTRKGTYNTLVWNAQPNRFYSVLWRPALGSNSTWQMFFDLSWPGGAAIGFDDFGDSRFYGIGVRRPLTPQ